MTETSNPTRAANPYGGVPSGGITLPPYYRPTPDLVSNNRYYPGQEELGPDEMRISFIDLVTRAQIEQIRAWLDDRFHRYRLVEAAHGEVPLEILLSVGQFDPSRLDGTPAAGWRDHCGDHIHDGRHDHGQAFRTWSYETDQPLSLETLQETVSKLPASVYRCKGIVHTVDEPSRRTILQVSANG